MPKSPILGGFSKSRSTNLSDNELTNLIVEIVETKDGKVPGALYNSAGLDLIIAAGSGPIRGMRDLSGLLYVVSGPDVYSITQNGIVTDLGTIGAQPTPVSMFNNISQLMIVDGTAAWLVPGGYPLTGGTIGVTGGLFAVGDTITLLPNGGEASAFPILTVTATSSAPVTAFSLTNHGTTYSSNTNVATTAIQGQPGGGSGLTLNTTASAGVVGSAAINVGGTGYAVNDTGTINGGASNAIYRVTTVAAGVVTAVIILNGGAAYASASAVPTTRGSPPGNAGLGFTVNTTASAGPISAAVVNQGGRGYAIGNAGLITGGTGNATYLVTAIGLNGGVSAFTVSTPGALVSKPASFTQKSTSGSGANFTLTAPTFGAHIGIVPVVVPFPNPVMGAMSDGFGLMVFLNSQNIAQSDQADLSTWQPLNFGVANQSPDKNMAITVIHDEAYVLKERNTEVWVDQGTPGFAFAPLPGVHIEYGNMAPFSMAKAGELLLWLSRNDQGQGVVVLAKGYSIEPISTQAMTAELDTYPTLGDAIGYSFQQGGHVFYVLIFPQANKTWQYDLTSSQLAGYPIWNRLGAWVPTNGGQFDRHWSNCFWNWRGAPAPVDTTTVYQANSVIITKPTSLVTATGLNGLAPSFNTALLSVWLLIPDIGANTGLIFSNQTDDTHVATNPGLFVSFQNDFTGTPQIVVKAWDAANAAIVSATYNFATWAGWVNLLLSINTTTQVLQVYASTLVGGLLVETPLTPASITWSSHNKIAATATQPWHVAVV